MTDQSRPINQMGFMRLPQILEHIIPVSEATWWNGCRSGKYPKPYKLGPRITAWKISDIQAYCDSIKPNELHSDQE